MDPVERLRTMQFPKIPNTVENMDSCFKECVNMVKPPSISNSVTSMVNLL